MPRPPIPPDQRQRAYKACEACKASKRRCDAQLPCGTCVRRNAGPACSYSCSSRRGHGRKRRGPDMPRAESIRSAPSPMLDLSTPISTHEPIDDDTDAELEAHAGAKVAVPVLARPRVVFNARRERVFVGDAASLSLMQFLRDILAQHLGPCIFAENARSVQGEGLGEDPSPSVEGDLKQKSDLIEAYLAASNGLLDLYSKEDLGALMARTNNAHDAPNEQTAALYIAIAIGGQCRSSSALDVQYAERYFSLGQQAAFSGMAEDPSVTLTRCFILMAFYMLGACRRNAAFMYLGIAARSASSLGLHVTEHYATADDTERYTHASTWRSLRVMDTILSSLLGRLSTTLPFPSEPETFESGLTWTLQFRRVCQDAAYQVATVMDEIFHELLRTRSIDTSTAEQYLEKLNAFGANLPPDLRRYSRTTPVLLVEQEQLLGKLHVAGLYYWTVMLVTRPFLLFTMTCSSRHATSFVPYDKRAYAEIIKMSRVCVSAAIYMVQMCQKALEPGSLLNNMCMLKGWIYSSGLVLGFSMVTADHVPCDVEETFVGARKLLQKLSNSSPQTEHYYDVLSRLADAIFQYRQKKASEMRQEYPDLVIELLTVDGGKVAQRRTPTQRRQDTMDRSTKAHVSVAPMQSTSTTGDAYLFVDRLPSGRHDSGLPTASNGERGIPFDESLTLDNGLSNDAETSWDSFAMQLSQSFPLENGFEGLFT